MFIGEANFTVRPSVVIPHVWSFEQGVGAVNCVFLDCLNNAMDFYLNENGDNY